MVDEGKQRNIDHLETAVLNDSLEIDISSTNNEETDHVLRDSQTISCNNEDELLVLQHNDTESFIEADDQHLDFNGSDFGDEEEEEEEEEELLVMEEDDQGYESDLMEDDEDEPVGKTEKPYQRESDKPIHTCE